MQTQTFTKPNPLASYMRQPKIYISLPSNGNYWAPNSIIVPENGQFPVYSMTAKDELLFKTPDALMNGQAVVDVIQSCMPNIKNAWACPSIDMDTILIAIRMATYGEKMPLKHNIPVINEEVDYEMDLTVLLNKQQQNKWIEQIAIDQNFIIFVRPLTYKHMAKTNIKSFETTRILNMVQDDSVPEEKKLEIFNESFSNLTRITVDLVADSIFKIVIGEEEVTDPKFISEFISNSDKDIFKKIQNHLSELKDINEIKPLEFTTTEEQQAAGAPAVYTMPLSFNNSDFFAQGF